MNAPDNQPMTERQRGRELACEGILRARFGQRPSEAGRKALDQLRREDAQGSRFSSRIIWRWAWPLAAAAALVLGVYGVNAWQAQQAEPGVTGYVLETQGQVRVAGIGQLATGTAMHPGDFVQTGPDGYLKFIYADGSEIELSKNTQMTLGAARESRLFGLVQEKDGKMIRLDAGRLVAQVAKQPVDQPMILATRHARATVVGTSFSLEEKTDRSRLTVADGVVRLSDLTGGREIEVPDGCFAEAGPGLELKQTRVARINDGLLALYVFDEGKGAILHDVSGVDEPANLIIKRPWKTQWLPNGIRMDGAAKIMWATNTRNKILEALQATTNLTFEFWLRDDTDDSGFGRAFTKGEHGLLTHVVEIDEGGMPAIYYNGESRPSARRVFHRLPTNSSDLVFFYNMATMKTFTYWAGDCYMVAIYDRAFTTEDVRRNYEAGLAGIERHKKVDWKMGGQKANDTVQ